MRFAGPCWPFSFLQPLSPFAADFWQLITCRWHGAWPWTSIIPSQPSWRLSWAPFRRRMFQTSLKTRWATAAAQSECIRHKVISFTHFSSQQRFWLCQPFMSLDANAAAAFPKLCIAHPWSPKLPHPKPPLGATQIINDLRTAHKTSITLLFMSDAFEMLTPCLQVFLAFFAHKLLTAFQGRPHNL